MRVFISGILLGSSVLILLFLISAKARSYLVSPSGQLEALSRTQAIGTMIFVACIVVAWKSTGVQQVLRGLTVLHGQDLSHAFAVFVVSSSCLIIFQRSGLVASCDWHLDAYKLKVLLTVYTLLAVILIPLSLALNFTKFSLTKPLWQVPLVFGAIFVTTAFIEELLFRGLLQTCLSKLLSPTGALIVASLIFGLSHIVNTVGRFAFPNWRYVLLATIAGLGYGYVFRKTNSLLVSTLLHTLVDCTWVVLLRG